MFRLTLCSLGLAGKQRERLSKGGEAFITADGEEGFFTPEGGLWKLETNGSMKNADIFSPPGEKSKWPNSIQSWSKMKV